MPKKKSAENLSLISLRNIAKNIDKYWFSDVDRDFGENPHLLYVVGPFDCLTGDQIQCLIYTLSSMKQLRRQHLHVLISHKLRSLDLSQSTIIANNGLILKSVGYRCQKLTSLNISNCSSIPASSIAETVRSLPLLKYLGLNQTKSNNVIMSVIADYCLYLTTLEIASCQITDVGAQNLCGINLHDGPKCKFLSKFDVKGTKIGMKGASLIINTFKHLQMFMFADSIEALKQVICEMDSNHRNIEENVFKLRQLSAMGVKCLDLSVESVALSAIFCPYVTELFLYRGATNEHMQYLKELKFLNTLKITSDQVRDVTFIEGLLPLLKVKGDNFRYLGLFDIDDLDICKLGYYCPNLENLNIFMSMFNQVKFYSSINSINSYKSTKKFHNLKELRFVLGENDANMTSTELCFVLENAIQIRKITLINIQCLTENVLKQIYLLNPLVYLQYIEFETCHLLGEQSIWHLIGCESSLRQLTLTCCHDITLRNLEEFRKYVKSNNLDFVIYGNTQ